jgi:predicted CopG family antitoxin
MEEKELIEIFENLIKDCTRLAEGTQYAQNLQVLDDAHKALKQVKENGVLHSISNSVRKEVERRRDLIISEPDGVVRETMISNLAIDL